MADEQESGPPNKRRRPPTTIDVKATEIASDAASAAEPADPGSERPPAEAIAEPTKQPEPDVGPPPAGEGSRAGGRRDRLDLSGRVNWRLIAAAGAGALAILVIAFALWGAGALHPRDDLTPRLAVLEQQMR